MADPRFFERQGPFTLAELAKRAGAEVLRPAGDGRLFRDVAALDEAGADDVSFLENPRYAAQLAASAAGVCVVEPAHAERAPAGMALLGSPRPRRAYALIARAFYPLAAPAPGIHATAAVDPTAVVAEGCLIEAGAVVAARARLGARCHVAPNAVIGEGVEIGADSRIGANASLSHCLIGERVVIYPGVRIGQPGFGFDPGADGHLTIPQLGRVIVEDDAEIGANTTIDRGAGPDTVIGRGAMIDNLVQIGHNVRVGAGSILVSQVGVSGSTRIGRFVTLGGQVGIAGHVTIGDGASVAAKSGVHSDIPAGAKYGGYPAVPLGEWRRQFGLLRRLLRKRPTSEATEE